MSLYIVNAFFVLMIIHEMGYDCQHRHAYVHGIE